MKQLILFFFSITLLFSAQPAFLMPEDAFKPSAKLKTNQQIEAKIWIADEIYLYEDVLKLKINEDSGIDILNIVKPKSSDHNGDKVYLDSPSFIITLSKKENISGLKPIVLSITYQGCSEKGLCYEPTTLKYNFDIDTEKLEVSQKKLKTLLKKIEPEKIEAKEEVKKILEEEVEEEFSATDTIANSIKSGNVLLVLLTFFGFGVLLSLTPCVFPMIPIISGVIVSQGEGLTTKKAFVLSVVYVLSMATAYSIAGVLSGIFGEGLQAALQTPWVIYSFSAVFVVLAFSMFGFFELKLPDSLVAKISGNSNRSGFIGVAIMGFLSALIVGPCVAAPLAGALVYIGQTGDAVLGGLALFFMGIGMGLPLIVVGVSAGRFMPKPGGWMTMVSAIFGVMMLGIAIWMLERVVDPSITMLLYSMLGLGFAIYFGALEDGAHIFRRSISIIIFIYSISLFVGVMGGSTSMTKPLQFLSGGGSVATTSLHVEFETVTNIEELDVVLAKSKGKQIILDFAADWCASCKELEEITFVDADVIKRMNDFVLVRADLTANGSEQKALSKKYGVFGPPVIIFFDEDTKVKKSKTLVGFIEPQEFLNHLNSI